MIETIYTRLIQYWETFLSAPVEMKIMLGMATVMAGMVVRSTWRLVLPVRWATALSLRGIARVLHKPTTKNRPLLTGPLPERREFPLSITQEIAKIKGTYDLLKFLEKYKKGIQNISDRDLKLIVDICSNVSFKNNDNIKLKDQYDSEYTSRENDKILKQNIDCLINPKIDVPVESGFYRTSYGAISGYMELPNNDSSSYYSGVPIEHCHVPKTNT